MTPSALVVSSSGCNVVPIEMGENFQRRGVRVVALVSRGHADASTSRRADGKKLTDFADLVLDTGAPVRDAMVRTDGLDTGAGRATPKLGGTGFTHGFQVAMAELLCAIEEHREPVHRARQHLDSLALCFAALQSAESGEAQRITPPPNFP
jgi:uncharacterized phosphosugar-binding protein